MKKHFLVSASLLVGLLASCQSDVQEMSLDKDDEAKVSFAVDFSAEDALLTRAEHNFEYYIAISSDAVDGDNITSGYVGRFTSLSEASIALKKGTEYSFYITAFEDAGYTYDLSSLCTTQGEFILVSSPVIYAPAFEDQKVDRYFGSTSQTINTSTTIAVDGTRYAYGINVNVAPPLEGKVVLSSESPAFSYTVLSTDEAIVESNIFCLAGVDPETSKSVDVSMTLYNAEGSVVATTDKTLNISRNHSRTIKVTALDPNANFSFSVDDDNMEDDGEEDMTPEVSQNIIDGHEYVEINGVKWATCNIGANRCEDFGNYYSWGATTSLVSSIEKNSNGGYVVNWINPNNKYSYYNYNILPANPSSLPLDNDVAHLLWGGKWRMPTYEEAQSLMNYANYQDVEVNGIMCREYINDDKHLFLPTSGHIGVDRIFEPPYVNYEADNKFCYDVVSYTGVWGSFWTSTLNSSNNKKAYYLSFLTQTLYLDTTGGGGFPFRHCAMPIRPVYAE